MLTPLCTNLASVNPGQTEGDAKAIRCKRWSCPTCAKINKARVIALAKRGRPRALLTLTVRSSDYADPDEAAEALKEGLRLLRLRLKRHARLENFEFLAVFEQHESGYPHLHLLIRGKFIPWQWLRRVWEEMTGAYMVDIRKIDTIGQAAMYCAKYITKELAVFEGCKRWWRSHGYKDVTGEDDYSPPFRPNARTWQVDIHRLRSTLLAFGWNVEQPRPGEIRWSHRSTAPPDLPLEAALWHLRASKPLWGGQ